MEKSKESIKRILDGNNYILINSQVPDSPEIVYGDNFDKTAPTAAIIALISLLSIFCTNVPNGNEKVYKNALAQMMITIKQCVMEAIELKIKSYPELQNKNKKFGSSKIKK